MRRRAGLATLGALAREAVVALADAQRLRRRRTCFLVRALRPLLTRASRSPAVRRTAYVAAARPRPPRRRLGLGQLVATPRTVAPAAVQASLRLAVPNGQVLRKRKPEEVLPGRSMRAA